MTQFDMLFYAVFTRYKPKYKQKANTIAVTYVSVLQCLLVLLLGVFFAGFSRQMHMNTMSQENAWGVFVAISVFIFFKNWMLYTGKKRMMIQAKMNKRKAPEYSLWLLWVLPIAVLGLAYVLFQAT